MQQPPNAALLANESRIITTPDAFYFCDTEKGDLTCQKTTPRSGGGADPTLVGGVAGPGFVTPELALGLVAAAAFVPEAKIYQSEKTIAGEPSLCATVSDLEAAASPGDADAPKDFTICVTDAGVLASFSGTTTSGEAASIELTSYATTADAAAFAPPPGTNIVDVTEIGVPPTP